MKKSEMLQKDRDNLVLLAQRMTPEERLMAFFHHSKLVYQLYQAGLSHRSAVRPPSKHRAKTR